MSKIDDVLSLPGEVDIRLICPDILVVEQVVPSWREELIQVAEKIDIWEKSVQVSYSGGDSSFANPHRNSQSFMVTHNRSSYGPCLRRFELALGKAFHTGVLAYMKYNPRLIVTDDSGYEFLRYSEGAHFNLHDDAVVGIYEGIRQLSALIYLNDDYSGGETHFPRQGVKYRGKAGDLLLFPSNFCYPHASLPVTKGVKYAVVTWFMAFPKKSVSERENHEANLDVVGSTDPERMSKQPSGSRNVEGEPQAPNPEYSTSTSRRSAQG